MDNKLNRRRNETMNNWCKRIAQHVTDNRPTLEETHKLFVTISDCSYRRGFNDGEASALGYV